MSESMEAEADEHEVTCAARRAVVELLAQRLKVRCVRKTDIGLFVANAMRINQRHEVLASWESLVPMVCTIWTISNQVGLSTEMGEV